MKKTNNEESKTVTTNSVRTAKKTTKAKTVKKNAKPKKSLGKMAKETTSELKKVSWPTFPQVVKQTGVVIAVVIVFTAVLFGFDRLFGWLYTILIELVKGA